MKIQLFFIFPGTSILKQFRKKQHEVKTDKVSGDLRAPTMSDLHRFYIEIISNSKCVICNEKMYELSDNHTRRQTLAYRHAYRSHVSEELKFHLLQSQISSNIQNMLTCPICHETHDTYASILEHFCVNHKKVQESFWQLVHFKTTFLSQAMANPSIGQNQDPDDQDQELAKFGQENTHSINEAKKLMTIPMNETRIQPMACFLMSEDLEHCHECWKVRIGQGTIGSICQFEGFRKVKRVPTDWKHPFAFESVGFLDPFKDPIPKDLELWTLPTKEIDVKDAKTILLRAGDQFCNLAKEELDKIEEYKKKGQHPIWKRLQYKVREMCDVCSTSLFNAHFTCTECGIIVCIDCHEVRCKGGLQYQGSSGTYKSRRKISRQNYDQHFWPFCKENGNVHQPEKLILTQVICGDVLKDMYDRVHKLKKKMNMKLDCNCCKKAEVEEIKSAPDTVQAPPKKTSPPPPKKKKKEILPTKFISSFDKCPVCQKYPLKKDSPLAPALHMLKHFGKDLEAKLSKVGPYTCPQCDWEDDEKVNTMLHLALDHNELEHVFKVWKMKKYTIKNIVLKVDKAESCKQCGMDYNEHQMGHPEIRKHLYTHFRNDINEFGTKVGSNPDKYKCNFQVECEFETDSKGRLTDHIGIFHRYLDTIVDKLEVKPKKKKMSLSDYAKKNSIQEPIKTEPAVKKEPPEPMVIKDHSCPVCDIWDSKENIRKHAMEHFELELKELIKDRDFSDACPNCPYDYNLALDHLALDHGWIDKLLNDQPTIVDKRVEYFENHALPKILNRKRRPSVDLTLNKRIKQDFKCLLCGTVLPDKDLDYAINHFATHVWLQLQKLRPNSKNQKDDLFNCFMRNLPLDSYVSHYGLRQNSKEHQQFMNGITSKIREVINEKWCCICQKSQQPSSNQHQKCEQKICSKSKNLSTLDDIESLRSVISPEKSRSRSRIDKAELEKDENGREFCDYCPEGFQTKDYYKHMALGHMRDLFVRDIIPKHSTKDRKCKQCTFFKASNDDDLILHLAEKHKLLERYLYLMEDKEQSGKRDIFKDMIKEVVITEDPKTLMYRCNSCKTSYKDLQSVREHVKKHFKQNWPLPAMQPYICPECFYEAATYLSLFKHVGTTHGEELKSIWNKEVAKKNLVPFTIGGKNLPVMQSKSYKKHFTITQPSQETKVKKPKVKFVDFLQQQFKDVQAIEKPKEEEPEKMEEDLEANIHPPSRVTCRHLNLEQYTPHRWLCDGRLLMLEDPKHENNQRLFQEQWIRGQPVIMCNASEHLNKHLWHPEAFLKDFGHLKHDLVNCLSGKVIPKAQLTEFWKGFQTIGQRLKDKNGTPMLLKLKDWPPTEDIANYMPNRFNDLINAYPLPEYTHREGALNLASYLPDYCLKPELGPKMYIAYGSALYSNKGSTNLHIDMSDAVNMLVYVGFPSDGDMQENAKEVFKEVDKAGCDILMKRRVRSRNILPGALWHIFHPSDTCKIRDFLNKVALEKGVRLDPHDDPIHDQSTYLDGHLRRRLYTEYGVKGYAIVQCAGDTVFIPAGGAHQVRNLHNCIKVAEDFVSPENISHCLHLTNEFRHLTEWHSNHEDKLQIKTILFHAIKTALAALEEK